MSDYLLFLILLAICLGGISFDGRAKQIVYIVLAILGILAFFGGSMLQVR